MTTIAQPYLIDPDPDDRPPTLSEWRAAGLTERPLRQLLDEPESEWVISDCYIRGRIEFLVINYHNKSLFRTGLGPSLSRNEPTRSDILRAARESNR